MVHGPSAGLDLLATLDQDNRVAHYHRLLATRAHVLELSGVHAAAAAAYDQAARRATSLPERRYLASRATELASAVPHDVDVLVVGTADPDDLDELARTAQERLYRPVNIRRISPAAWASADLSDPFLNSVRERPLIELTMTGHDEAG